MNGLLSSTVLLSSITFLMVALISVGVASAARLAGWTHPRMFAAAVGAGLGLWLAFTATLAESGVIALGMEGPPRVLLLPLIAMGTYFLLGRTEGFRRLQAALPAWRPIALQSFRIVVEFALWRLYREGIAPLQMTFEGRNWDGLVGLSAPIIALGLATRRVGPQAAIVWNLFGLALLANAIGTTATSVPGPLHFDWPGQPFTAIAAWPVVWLPAFLAPTGVFLHVLSIRQAVAHCGMSRITGESFNVISSERSSP